MLNIQTKNNRINEPGSPDNDLGYADQLLSGSAQKKRPREDELEGTGRKALISNIKCL